MRRRDRIFFYRSLVLFLDGGQSIEQALQSLSKKKITFTAELIEINTRLRKGLSLGDCLENWVEREKSFITVAERSGELVLMLKFLVQQLEREQEVERYILSRLWQPFFLLACAIFIFPSLEYFFGHMSWIGLASLTFLPTVIILLFLLWGCWNWYSNYRFREKLMLYLINVPFLRNLILNYEAYYFFWVYSILLRAGIEINETLKLLSTVLFSSERKKAISLAKKKASEHKCFIKLFESVFDFDDISRWQVSQETGEEEGVLRNIGNDYKKRFEIQIERFAKWVPKIIYFVSAVYVFWRLFAFLGSALGEVEKYF